MSHFNLVQESCVDQNVDAIVNAANAYLQPGGGVCGAVFSKAGRQALINECDKIATPLPDGSAVVTPALGIVNAKYIIHAVGPNFSVSPVAFKELFEAYYNSFLRLKEHGLHSIALCLVSSGIYGGRLPDAPRESAKQCIRAYNQFVKEYPDYDIEATLCAFTPKEFKSALKEFVLYF